MCIFSVAFAHTCISHFGPTKVCWGGGKRDLAVYVNAVGVEWRVKIGVNPDDSGSAAIIGRRKKKRLTFWIDWIFFC